MIKKGKKFTENFKIGFEEANLLFKDLNIPDIIQKS